MRRFLLFGLAATVTACGLLIAATGPAAAQEQPPTPLDRIIGDRIPEGMLVSACLPGASAAPGSPTVPSRTEVFVERRSIAVLSDAVVVLDDEVAPTEDCASGVWVVVVVEVGDIGPDPNVGLQSSFHVRLRVDLLGGPSSGASFEGQRSLRLHDGRPTGMIERMESTPDGLRVRGYVVDPENGAPPRIRLRVSGFEIMSDDLRATRWSQLLDVRTFLHVDGLHSDEAGLRGPYGFEITVPYGQVCLYVPDPSSNSDLLSSALEIDCRHPTFYGQRSAKIRAVSTARGASSAGESVVLSGTMTDPWVGPGEPGPELLAVIQGSGESVTVRGRARSDLVGPLVDGSGAFDFHATIPNVGGGTRTVCVYDRSTSAPSWWHLWSPRSPEPLDCIQVGVGYNMAMPAFGNVEAVEVAGRTVTMTGWALDPNGGTTRVLMIVNGLPVAVAPTSIARPDVRAAHGGDGLAGYHLSVSLPPGSHRVCSAWEDTDILGWTHGPCQDVIVK